MLILRYNGISNYFFLEYSIIFVDDYHLLFFFHPFENYIFIKFLFTSFQIIWLQVDSNLKIL